MHTGSESGRYLGVMYLEALVWVVTLLVLMVDVGERFWPPFVCLAAWIVFVVFTLFYTQVGANELSLNSKHCQVSLFERKHSGSGWHRDCQ